MTNTTLAQIVLAAQAAVNATLPTAAQPNPRDALAVQTVKLEEFARTGFDRGDFATFENAFNAQLDMLATFGQQDSPATIAAKKAAAAK